ncbi:MAG TPA: arylsulfotransferase family protein, partial [Thermoanaerobaculia bacterium]|nr:arylsulfotransferase family protein [Thermoanaerobaculia bacterium]
EGTDPGLRGVVHHDPARAWPGLNLYTNDADEAYLMDMDGRRVHRWRLPKTPKQHCEHAELLAGGELAVVCVNDGLFVLDRSSNVLYEHRRKVHHDVAALHDGTLIVPFHAVRPYRRRMVYFDGLSWIAPGGRTVRTWWSWRHLDRLQPHHPPSPLDQPGAWRKLLSRSYDYYHLNTVESLAATALGERDARFRAGNLLLCMRHPALILILDQDTEEVVWSWGPGVLDGPHMPTLLDNGHLLIFDNGTERGWSRVIELDPVTLEIAWEYRGDPPEAFHSNWRGSSQRLPNGNTLLCESDKGRVFEITPQGETVWEFWNPEMRRRGEHGTDRKGIYRFTRVEAGLHRPPRDSEPVHGRLLDSSAEVPRGEVLQSAPRQGEEEDA